MNHFVHTKHRYGALLSGLIFLAATTNAHSASRTAPRHHVAKTHHPVTAAWWPHITTLNPNNFTVELGPDFGYDSTSHGAADNPATVTVIVMGYHFRHGATVRWDNKPLSTKFVSSTRLDAMIPNEKMMDKIWDDPPQAAITVVNPGIKGHASHPVPFTMSHWAMGG